MERRKLTFSKASPLPLDYIRMVESVFVRHFDQELELYREIKPKSQFEARGEIYSDEVIVAVSLTTENVLAATTVHGSVDFDPKASAPTVEELLSACIDAIAAAFSAVLVPENLQAVAEETLAPLEEAPFEWTKTPSNQIAVWVRMDKSNPKFDAVADQWLAKHDPQYQEKLQEEQQATEDLFVTGNKAKNQGYKH